MIIPFEKYRLRRLKEQDYRLTLIDQISCWYDSRPDMERPDAFYFEHIRSHFSIEMLENILSRLNQKASNE